MSDLKTVRNFDSVVSIDVIRMKSYLGCLPFDRKIRLECEKHNGKGFTNLPQKCHIRYGLNPKKGRICVA